jgi:hypothetical protein
MSLDLARIERETRNLPVQERVTLLEAILLEELTVVGSLYGGTAAAHAQWAARVMGSSELAAHHASAWRHGKRLAWRRIQQLAGLLRRVTGELDYQWQERVTLLELAAGKELQQPAPTTVAAPWASAGTVR